MSLAPRALATDEPTRLLRGVSSLCRNEHSKLGPRILAQHFTSTASPEDICILDPFDTNFPFN